MCGNSDASAGTGSKGGGQRKLTSRAWPPKQLTVALVNQALGAHMRLARIRMGYSVVELSQLSGVSIEEVEGVELGNFEELPVINSVRLGLVFRDALGPMWWDADLFRGAADATSAFYPTKSTPAAKQAH